VAVLAAGSVGRGEADAHSDIDLDVYWSGPPSDVERREIVGAAGGVLVGDVAPLEEEEWAETYRIGKLRVTTSMFLTETLERYLAEVVDGCSVEELPQMRIAAVQHGAPLVGEALIDRWRTRARAYPDGLRRAMVRHHLQPQTTWRAAPKLAERGDLVFLNETLVRAAHAMLGSLHGVNCLYLSHRGYKWMHRLAAEMPIAPFHFLDRLASVFSLPPRDSVAVLQTLLEETLELVEANLPDEDLTTARSWITARRLAG
jgi:hypothetical protein